MSLPAVSPPRFHSASVPHAFVCLSYSWLSRLALFPSSRRSGYACVASDNNMLMCLGAGMALAPGALLLACETFELLGDVVRRAGTVLHLHVCVIFGYVKSCAHLNS